ILPELAACAGLSQNEYHAYDVFEHSVRTAARVRPDVALRLAALWHDIGKGPTRSLGPDGRVHFYGHERVSAELVGAIGERLRLPGGTRQRIVVLVRHHQYPFSPEITPAAFRRVVARVGREAFADLIELVWADRLATGRIRRSDADRLRTELSRRFDALLATDQALNRRQLALDGRDVISLLGVAPGPVVGEALSFLLERVLDDPALNRRSALEHCLREWWAARSASGG
ncbi:MAG TPA: HD domain-containing protein, partial [Limnochordia bacterium]